MSPNSEMISALDKLLDAIASPNYRTSSISVYPEDGSC